MILTDSQTARVNLDRQLAASTKEMRRRQARDVKGKGRAKDDDDDDDNAGFFGAAAVANAPDLPLFGLRIAADYDSASPPIPSVAKSAAPSVAPVASDSVVEEIAGLEVAKKGTKAWPGVETA